MARNIKGGPLGGIARRRMLKGAAGIAARRWEAERNRLPAIWAQNNKELVLRQCGTGVGDQTRSPKCKGRSRHHPADDGARLDAVVQRVGPENRSTSAESRLDDPRRSSRPTISRVGRQKIKTSDKIVPISPPAS